MMEKLTSSVELGGWWMMCQIVTCRQLLTAALADVADFLHYPRDLQS
jgi:hypothetical protein